MIPFHSLCPEVAQREVRCVHVVAGPGAGPAYGPPVDEYAFLEFYCEDLQCDCRRAFLQMISRGQPGKIFASINVGWEDEAFYRKRRPWDRDAARGIVRGELDPINAQSEFARSFWTYSSAWSWTYLIACGYGGITGLFRAELERRSPSATDL